MLHLVCMLQRGLRGIEVAPLTDPELFFKMVNKMVIIYFIICLFQEQNVFGGYGGLSSFIEALQRQSCLSCVLVNPPRPSSLIILGQVPRAAPAWPHLPGRLFAPLFDNQFKVATGSR